MATKKKTRKVSYLGLSLSRLQRLAKAVYGPIARVREDLGVQCVKTSGKEVHLRVFVEEHPWAITDERLVVCHPDRAVARRMLRAALEAAA